MTSFADIVDYLGKLLALWFLRLFAQDTTNPHYRYAWMPPVAGRQFGFVICDSANNVVAKNIGPAANTGLPDECGDCDQPGIIGAAPRAVLRPREIHG